DGDVVVAVAVVDDAGHVAVADYDYGYVHIHVHDDRPDSGRAWPDLGQSGQCVLYLLHSSGPFSWAWRLLWRPPPGAAAGRGGSHANVPVHDPVLDPARRGCTHRCDRLRPGAG